MVVFPWCLIKSNNLPKFKLTTWTQILCKFVIDQAFTKPHHPNENLAELCGILKTATVHIMALVGMPHEFWCFALALIAFMGTHLARPNPNPRLLITVYS